MRAFWNQLLDLLFPPQCAGCGKGGTWFCGSCMGQCEPLSPTYNARRHQELRTTTLTTSVGVFAYKPPLREAIHALKYKRLHVLAKPLGTCIVHYGRPKLPDVDAVVAVPLFRDRLYERGFNQSVLLARVVAQNLDLPLLEGPLRRTRSTSQQATLDRPARQANVKDAFTWRGTPPPQRILLIDDVLTSGATMEACAAAIRSAGAVEVHGLALARGGT